MGERPRRGSDCLWSLRKLRPQILRVIVFPSALAEFLIDICKLSLLHSPAVSIILSLAHLFVLVSCSVLNRGSWHS